MLKLWRWLGCWHKRKRIVWKSINYIEHTTANRQIKILQQNTDMASTSVKAYSGGSCFPSCTVISRSFFFKQDDKARIDLNTFHCNAKHSSTSVFLTCIVLHQCVALESQDHTKSWSCGPEGWSNSTGNNISIDWTLFYISNIPDLRVWPDRWVYRAFFRYSLNTGKQLLFTNFSL